MAAHQVPPSLGFSKQEHWSGLPFPSPMHESEIESEVAQSCPTPSDPMDCGPPGSSVHGIFQARALEWGAIAQQTIQKFLVYIQFDFWNLFYTPYSEPSSPSCYFFCPFSFAMTVLLIPLISFPNCQISKYSLIYRAGQSSPNSYS